MINQQQTTTFHSNAGHLIHVRRLQSDDAPLLVDIFEHMTSDSRYRRYHQTLDHVSADRIQQEALQITQADPGKNRCLIAFTDVPGQTAVPIGAVRFVQTSPQEAEVAISIRDDFQNMGIGTQLMRLLAEEARVMGFRRLTADILNDNLAILHVFNSLPYPVLRSLEGTNSNLMITLTPQGEIVSSNLTG
jgi:acetyltransferase